MVVFHLRNATSTVHICGGHIRDEIRHITHMAEMHRRSATQFQQDRNIESKEAPKLKQNNKKKKKKKIQKKARHKNQQNIVVKWITSASAASHRMNFYLSK